MYIFERRMAYEKDFFFLFALLMFSSLCLPANAFDAIETGSNDSFQETLLQEFERTKSIRVQNMLAYINDIENQLTMNGLHGESRTEYGTTVIKSISGEPSGQPTYGYTYLNCDGVVFLYGRRRANC